MVSDVTINSALEQQQKTSNAGTQLTEDFAQFLNLLTVQLQNQDPLSPMDTTEFTNQLVAFSGVEQQINTNQKLDSLVSLEIGTAFSVAQNYVGQDVSYISSEFDFTGAPTKLRYSLEGNAALSKINITDEQGKLVYTTDASKNIGAHEFVWDGTLTAGGKAKSGTYEIHIDALDVNQDPVNTTTVVTGRVRGTETQGGQIFLLVGDRAVGLSNILNTSEKDNLGNNNDSLTMAISYVGMEINYLNTELQYDGSTPVDLSYSLDENADRAKIMIVNDDGETVYLADAPKNKGLNAFTWDGTLSDGSNAPAGTYQFIIDAIGSDDKRITSSSIANGQVTGVETNNGQIFLNIGTTSVNINNVLSANLPEETI